jgi:hypothetical protein
MNSSFSETLLQLDRELQKSSDSELIIRIKTAVREEREKVTFVLHHLREVDRRRLYSALECKSLHQFATKHLQYTDDEAYRRIAAMKLLRALPEIEERIVSGDLALTHLNMAQTFFRQEEKATQKPMSREEKIHVMEQMVGTSIREAEKITLALSSNEVKVKPDKLKQVTVNQIEVRFTAREALQTKTEKLKGFLAHSHPGISLGELYEKLCDLGLEHWDPSRPPKRSKAKQKPKGPEEKKKSQEKSEVSGKGKQESLNPNQAESFATPRKGCVENEMDQEKLAILKENDFKDMKEPNCRSEEFAAFRKQGVEALGKGSLEIKSTQAKSKAQIRREVFRRAENKCENCGSEYALEIDHIIPQTLGGSSDSENLRLLCKHCNQRAAIEAFGQQKMDIYLHP